MNRLVPLVLTFVAGVLLGYFGLTRTPSDEVAGAGVAAQVSHQPPSNSHGKTPAQTPPLAETNEANPLRAIQSAPAYQTLHDIQKLETDFAETAALYGLVQASDVAQLEALLEEAQTLDQVSEFLAASHIIYQRYADLDPAAALDHLLTHAGMQTDRWIGSIFHTWSRGDFDAALAAVRELDKGLQRVALMAIVQARDDLSAGERRGLAEEFGLESLFDRFHTTETMARLGGSPERAWETARTLENAAQRQRQLYNVATMWARHQPTAAAEHAMRLDANERAMALRGVMQTWGASEPQAAVDWMLANGLTELTDTAALQIAFGYLANADRASATSLIDTIADVNVRSTLTQVTLSAWATKDPRAAAQWMAGLSVSERERSLQMVVSQYVSSYPEEALDWALDIDGQDSAQIVSSAINALAGVDIERAVAAATDLADEGQRISAMNTVAHQWSNIDPDAALSWALDQAPDHRGQLATAVMREWVARAPADASSAIGRITDTPLRDQISASLVDRTARRQVEVADDLAESIVNAELRERSRRRVYRAYLRYDEQQAEIYRRRHGLAAAGE